MTDENKVVETKECNCFCHSKAFRKFLVISCGTFVGVFLALSLFAALHKPPMPMPCPCGCHHQMVRPYGVPHYFDRSPRGDFHRKFEKRDIQMHQRESKPVLEGDN